MTWIYRFSRNFLTFQILLLIPLQITLSYHLKVILVVILIIFLRIYPTIHIQHIFIIRINLLWPFPFNIILIISSSSFSHLFSNVYLLGILVDLLFLCEGFRRFVWATFVVFYVRGSVDGFHFGFCDWLRL